MPQLDLTPKQHVMIYDLADLDEIMWGGEAGGGKSEGLLMFALRRRIEIPGSAGLMMRRTFPDLDRSLIRKSQKYYRPFAKWHEAKKKWVFRNGSIQDFGYCDSDNDVYQYQSYEADDICIDEVTQWSEFAYLYMLSRLRPASGKDTHKTVMRCATNPGNIGHLWVKARFVDVAKEKRFKVWDEETQRWKSRYFLPAGLDDNTLMTPQARAEYRSWLAQLPPDQKEMLMHGNWDYVIGAAFAELHRKTHEYDPKTFPVPSSADIYMSYDFGFGAPFSIGWWWLDFDGRMWRFAEWYGWTGKPNQGIRMSPTLVARDIHKIEKKMGIKGRVTQRVADPSIFWKTADIRGGGLGPPVAEMFGNEGIHLTSGDNDRIAGKQQIHDRFRVPENFDRKNSLTFPMMMISSDCQQWWRTIPVLSSGDWGTPRFDDVEDKQEDHVYDETRYFAMSRPMTPIHSKPKDTPAQRLMKRVQIPKSTEENWFDFEGRA